MSTEHNDTRATRMNPWSPDANPHQARRVGKSLEELNELGNVLARISIQGIDAIDPASGKSNRQRLHEETADVLAQIDCNINSFEMDRVAIRARADRKIGLMAEWESHFDPGAAQPAPVVALDAPEESGSEEAAEIIGNLIANIERDGMYSKESTLGFLSQALYCLRPANKVHSVATASGDVVYRWQALNYSGFCYGSNPPADLPARCNLTAFYRRPEQASDSLPVALYNPILPSYGDLPWGVVVAHVKAAIGAMPSIKPEEFIGHQIVGINFNSLNRIMSALVKGRAA